MAAAEINEGEVAQATFFLAPDTGLPAADERLRSALAELGLGLEVSRKHPSGSIIAKDSDGCRLPGLEARLYGAALTALYAWEQAARRSARRPLR